LHARPELKVTRTNALDLLYVEMSAHLAKNDAPGAMKAAERVVQSYPSDEEVLASAAQVFMNFGSFSNALPLIDQQLKLAPDNLNALRNKGVASLQTGAYDDAISALSKVLSIETNTASDTHNTALLSRAIAYLKSGKLDEAQADYEMLLHRF